MLCVHDGGDMGRPRMSRTLRSLSWMNSLTATDTPNAMLSIWSSAMVQEVYLFAERGPDGRFTRIEEATVLLDQRSSREIVAPSGAPQSRLSAARHLAEADITGKHLVTVI